MSEGFELRIEGTDRSPLALAEGQQLIFGRNKRCEVRLEGESKASRLHCRVWVEGGMVWVEDLGSRNGTFLNGKKIQQTEKLSDGDEIRIGEYVFEFKVEPQDRRRKTGPRLRDAGAAASAAQARKAPRTAAALPAFAFYGFLLFLLIGATVTSKLVFVWAYQQVLPG